jgi:hypothetical protein
MLVCSRVGRSISGKTASYPKMKVSTREDARQSKYRSECARCEVFPRTPPMRDSSTLNANLDVGMLRTCALVSSEKTRIQLLIGALVNQKIENQK